MASGYWILLVIAVAAVAGTAGVVFGRLAEDYRTFFAHFARTAQNLGMSEGRARELLQRADPRLVDHGGGHGARAGTAVPASGHEGGDPADAAQAAHEPDRPAGAADAGDATDDEGEREPRRDDRAPG